jgi:hypothetical protein
LSEGSKQEFKIAGGGELIQRTHANDDFHLFHRRRAPEVGQRVERRARAPRGFGP